MRGLLAFFIAVGFSVNIIGQNKTDYSNSVNINKSSLEELQIAMKQSQAEYKIVYKHSETCGASYYFRETLNELYLNSNKDSELFVFISDKTSKYNKYYEEFLYEGLSFPTYLIGKISVKKVLEQLCSDCNHKEFSNSNFVVLNSANEVVCYTTFKMTEAQKLEVLTKYL